MNDIGTSVGTRLEFVIESDESTNLACYVRALSVAVPSESDALANQLQTPPSAFRPIKLALSIERTRPPLSLSFNPSPHFLPLLSLSKLPARDQEELRTHGETKSATKGTQTAPFKKPKKLKPARKQVKPGDVVKTETVQTGKEYNIWYNKWAGGDREDNYSKYA
ncbi:hypothetical protein NMY22_g16986 [Coprinellus aureogranulatus]|nr:hypothetical protein NMY22_g16986 [Coprinellus aureogranulatus]